MYPGTSISGGERWAVFAQRGADRVERWFDSKTKAEEFADLLENEGFSQIQFELLPRISSVRNLLQDRGVA